MSKNTTRRNFLKTTSFTIGALAFSGGTIASLFSNYDNSKSKVYFTRDISPEGMVKVYEALGQELPGKVAVKLHSGEPGGHHYPAPKLVEKLVNKVNGTIVECNTAYPGKRFETESHRQVMKDHGFADIAPVEIMDADGEVVISCPENSKNIKENYVGKGFNNYDSFLILSHFKGHAMGGYGGALKNMSIGIASASGKMWIHTAGKTKDLNSFGEAFKANQDSFLESMAEASGSIIKKLGPKNLAYVNIMNNLSIDCDCNGHPAAPELEDIGVLASLDPVALDQACVDLIYKSDPDKSASLRNRIEEKHGTHTIDHAEYLGLGKKSYKIINV